MGVGITPGERALESMLLVRVRVRKREGKKEYRVIEKRRGTKTRHNLPTNATCLKILAWAAAWLNVTSESRLEGSLPASSYIV